jgi:hypothetical protein
VIGFGAEVHTERGVISAGTRDVSRGGCQLASSRALPEGVTMRIDLHLTVDGIQEPDVSHLTVHGRIQWTAESEDEHGTVHLSGVRFGPLAPADAEWLERVLRQHGAPVVTEDFEVDIDMD